MNQEFQTVALGALFTFGGNTWRKRSTRTAEIVQPERFIGQWFYFGKTEIVKGTCGPLRLHQEHPTGLHIPIRPEADDSTA